MAAHHPRELIALLQLTDLTELAQRAESLIRGGGLTGFVYAFANPGDWRVAGWTPYLNGLRPRWIERYAEAGHIRTDPVPAHCFRAGRHAPFLWRYETPGERAYAADALAHGIGAGVSFPLMTANGRPGAFSFAVDAVGPDAEEFILTHLGWLSLLTLYLHEAHQRLGALDESPQLPTLSKRELECLHWVALGKTNSQVAHKIGTSERTVKFHLENVRRKFGDLTTREVVARAIVLRIIQP